MEFVLFSIGIKKLYYNMQSKLFTSQKINFCFRTFYIFLKNILVSDFRLTSHIFCAFPKPNECILPFLVYARIPRLDVELTNVL